MLVGFFKKIVVADTVSVYVDAVYHNPDGASALGVTLATCLFAVQIYCDFSGYTDIAIGCARIMGIRLMKNFDHPYRAQSIKEFWSRWHISLSTWFRDYLYIPLGGNRKGSVRRYVNLFIVFLVSGLWHGASWTFVLWGALHGIYQIVGHLTLPYRNRLLDKTGLARREGLMCALRTLGTFVLVDFAWLFFRARSVGEAFVLVKKLFTAWSTPVGEVFSGMGFTLVGALTVLFGILTLIIIDRLLVYEDTADGSDVLVKNGAFIYVIWVILLLWVVLLSKGLTSTFIYFQF